MNTSPVKKKSSSNIILGIVLVFALCICVVGVFWLLAPRSNSAAEPTTTPQESAWFACTTFIERQVGLSAHDAQDYNPIGVQTLTNNRFHVEVYYAQQSDMYVCELSRHANGDMELLSLNVK